MSADLTQAVAAAGRGLRRDVKALCDALAGGDFFLPLGAPAPPSGVGPLEVAVHVLPDPQGRPFGALFTRAEFVARVGAKFGWKTGGAPLQYIAMKAPAALDLMRQMIERGKIHGAVINAFQNGFLDLSPQETLSLARGEALPLMRRVQSVPVQKGETFTVGEPAAPPPESLKRALDHFAAAQNEVAGYKIWQTFNPDRDLAPHLTAVLQTRSGQKCHAALAAALADRLRGSLKEDEYVDFLFDAVLAPTKPA